MQKLILIICLFITFNAIGADETYIPSLIKKVTVFRNGAQVYRTAKFSVPKGLSTIYLDGLTSQIDQQSLQLGGSGDMSITSMSYIHNYNYASPKSELFIGLESKLEDIQFEEVFCRDEINVLDQEESLILANKKVGTKEGVDIQKLMLMAKFYRERLLAIKRSKQLLTKKLTRLAKERQAVNKQIQDIRIKNTKPSTGVIALDITADKATMATIEFNYLVYNAGWITTYDLRVENINEPIDLLSKAIVTQSTGEDWTNVNIKISTGNPRRSSTLPALDIWYLDFYSPIYKKEISTSGYEQKAKMRPVTDGISLREDYNEKDISYAAVVAQENITSMEFSVQKKVSVPSDGKKHEIKLEHQEVKANFEYLAIPKRDKAAYLMARIPDWQDYKLMNGEANLYFEGTLVGKSMINSAQTSDTMNISLGVDIAVTVEYNCIKRSSKKKLISSKTTKTKGWEIVVNNSKGLAIDIIIKDQIPVAAQNDIEVNCTAKSKGHLNKDTGIVTWTKNIAPGKRENLKLIYEIKYPNKKTVILNN